MPNIEPLLKKSQVAEILQVDERTVDRYREDGIITPCRIPAVRYNPQEIRELIGVKLEKFSPLERKRFERELEEWKTRAEKAEAALRRINITATEAMLCEKEAFQI